MSGKEKNRPKSLGKIKEQGLLRDMADSRSGAINTQDEPGTSGPFQKVRMLSKKIDVVSKVLGVNLKKLQFAENGNSIRITNIIVVMKSVSS